MTISIAGTKIGPDHPPYIIAELSANHNGDIKRAFATIQAAKKCGANAIKIQTYTADTMTIDCNNPEFLIKGGLWDGYKLYDLYKWAETPYEWHKDLFEYAKKQNITIFSTPFDESAVDLLESLNSPAYKIASFELLDLPLLRYIASTGKPMIMSTGMASREEIEEAVTTVHDEGCTDLVLLHCISSYPAPIEKSNLKQIRELENTFNVLAGLSDHTLGTTIAITAVAMGACVIEKHFTLNRKDKGPDSDFSIEPDELSFLCKSAEEAWTALGKPGFKRPDDEEGNKMLRRSIYFVKDLPMGSLVTKADIRRIRPGLGLPPKYYDELIGKKLAIDVSKGTPTNWNQFSEG